eukprot:Gb_27246 [translate_table: standard]
MIPRLKWEIKHCCTRMKKTSCSPGRCIRPSGFGRSCQGLVDIITGHGALLPTWQSVVVFSVEHHVENRHLKWFSKGLGGAEHTLSTMWFALVKVCLKLFWSVSLVKFGPSSCPWRGVAFDVLIAMGGDPVITEPAVLSMEEDVRPILEDSGLLPFFKKFTGHNEAITNQFVETWKNGRVTINGMHIDVSESLIDEVTGLPNDGELVSRDKMDQSSYSGDEVYYLRRGAAIRVSGVPITKSQLLIGPAPPSLLLTSVNSESDADEDSESQGMVSPVIAPKEKEGKKRKLNDSLAKSSRRSYRLQRKTAGKSNVIVDAGSSDEEQKIDTAQGKIGRSSPTKSAAAIPSEKGEGSDSQPPSEDFLGHLRILNSLSGTLTSTCACLNLLIVEITNYLKEAAKGKKD